MDHASFLGLRALGRGPVIEFTWVFAEPVDTEALEALNRQLALGFLGRRIQRSPLPWGRPRWVAAPVPEPVTTLSVPIPLSQIAAQRSALADLPIDPEVGPGWRLVLQPLSDGGSVLSLLVSHSIADGLAVCQAIADAIHQRPATHRYPPSRRGSAWRALGEDLRDSIAEWPTVWRALRALVQQRHAVNPGTPNAPRQPPTDTAAPSAPVRVPLVQVALDATSLMTQSTTLGVTINTLVAYLAVRLAVRVGRVDADGQVTLVQPVSDRRPGDLRGNALRALRVKVVPATLADGAPVLRALDRTLRRELFATLRNNDPLALLLPLIPYVPLWLARRMESVVLGTDRPVGCSNCGELDPVTIRPLGIRATQLYISMLERHTVASLAQVGGMLLLGCGIVEGTARVTIQAWSADETPSPDALAGHLRLALQDCGLTGEIE
jgi:diacylglycerol O-acyltransferase